MSNRLVHAAALGLLLCLTASAVDLKMESVQIGSVTYTNVVVTDVNPADIYFHHNGGMANIKLRELDPELQKKLGFNPRLAAEIERQRLTNNEKFALAFAQTAKARADAEAKAANPEVEPPFSLADPLSPRSPLGKPAPDLAVKTWLSADQPDRAGKFTLVFFWNSTNLPSQRAIDALNDISRKNTNSVAVIALTTETEKQVTITKPPIEFSSASAPDATLANALGVQTIPSVALIDPRGIVRYLGHPAALTEDALKKLMAGYAAE